MLMVMFFTATLVASIVGLCALVGLKHWELATGRVALRGARPAVGAALSAALHWVERIAPGMLRRYARRAWAAARVLFLRYTAWGVLWTEKHLERLLQGLRHSTSVSHSPAEASAFLVEVAKHKKKLLKRPKEDRAIHEE